MTPHPPPGWEGKFPALFFLFIARTSLALVHALCKKKRKRTTSSQSALRPTSPCESRWTHGSRTNGAPWALL